MLTWHQREGRTLYMNRGIMLGVKPQNEAVLCLKKLFIHTVGNGTTLVGCWLNEQSHRP